MESKDLNVISISLMDEIIKIYLDTQNQLTSKDYGNRIDLKNLFILELNQLIEDFKEEMITLFN